MIVLPQREFGRSSVLLTTVGFGGAAIGNLYRPIEDAVAASTVAAALAEGIRYCDTAPHYGFGLSERRLGAVLVDASDVVISTKVGRTLKPVGADAARERHGFVDADPFEPEFDYSYDAVMRGFDESLRRLGRDQVEIVFAHDLGVQTHGEDHSARFKQFMEGGYRALEQLKADGRIQAIGLGANEWQVCAEALRHGDFDGFLLAGRYTLLEQTALDSFLPVCAARGASVVIGGPFNSGILAQGVRSGSPVRFNYAPAPPEVIEKVGAIEDLCRAHDVSLKAAALQFVLAHPQVTSVIPGAASPAEAAEAVHLIQARIPDEFWDALRSAGLLRSDAPTAPPESSRLTSRGLILLHPSDNVLVTAVDIRAGDRIVIDGRAMSAPDPVSVGHKVARHDLHVGDGVRKYGAPIGSMTADAGPGAHVHMHNMKSDYIASHTRDAVGGPA
ncbi:aldo/keto reductase [Brevundimonas sp.]|uniref:aldo/keto reductase n=1 Tax=Brevundimonas sp. TaxID=1871086 RepID=UPI002ABA0DF7|nr:aldo/keto reductase [Brevundimonas sp.]MDZ4363115.1 aldo/keto reductase [Brevundimonas sp.]